jgi:lipoprotein-anchoring transpeptidase ErfK/SrfK
LSSLFDYGYLVRWDEASKRAVVKSKAKPGVAIFVRRGDQRVVVNKSHLMLVGWQGQSVVFRSKVGIGRAGYDTPNGTFKVQPYRTEMHRSSLYNNTPMPWAVQIVGNIFVHGSPVAHGRSSHGCIRLPTSGKNPAKSFYDWVERGTAVSIQGHWPANAKA